MRTFCLAAAMAAALVSPALAQSAYDGPLAAPDAPATAPTVAPHHAKSKPKRARHAAVKPAAEKPATEKAATDDAFALPAAPGVPAREAQAPARKGVADDPLSLDMKWNGNNDSVAQTRSQNLDGNAFGSGAEVGMKLHF